ncbi:MAG: DUF2510 domain-containing protein [Actinobacteria bacterium]|nr:DUF2510 domain-containing protein [Actinomycetota bacterium]
MYGKHERSCRPAPGAGNTGHLAQQAWGPKAGRRSGRRRNGRKEEWRARSGAASRAADWYPDPQGLHRLRYWDGTAWTDHIAN